MGSRPNYALQRSVTGLSERAAGARTIIARLSGPGSCCCAHQATNTCISKDSSIWNASTKRFDYLFAVEPGSLAQERGEFRIEADGRIIRDVVLTDGKGRTSNFRQTFLRLDEDRFQTTLMRQTTENWTPTFPGSDNLTMVRRAR